MSVGDWDFGTVRYTPETLIDTFEDVLIDSKAAIKLEQLGPPLRAETTETPRHSFYKSKVQPLLNKMSEESQSSIGTERTLQSTHSKLSSFESLNLAFERAEKVKNTLVSLIKRRALVCYLMSLHGLGMRNFEVLIYV